MPRPTSRARSLVMSPCSIVCTQTSSRVRPNSATAGVPSSLPRCSSRASSEDGRDRVGRGGQALLVLAVVPGHGAVCGLGLYRAAVRRHQHAGHQAEGAEALGHHVRLDVTVVVLGGPDDAALPLEHLGHHVVDEPVLVDDPGRLELRLAASSCRTSPPPACGARPAASLASLGRPHPSACVVRAAPARRARPSRPAQTAPRPTCRRSTAFSCRSTSRSASFARSPLNARTARLSTRHVSK